MPLCIVNLQESHAMLNTSLSSKIKGSFCQEAFFLRHSFLGGPLGKHWIKSQLSPSKLFKNVNVTDTKGWHIHTLLVTDTLMQIFFYVYFDVTLRRCELGPQEEEQTISKGGKETDLPGVPATLKCSGVGRRSVTTAVLETEQEEGKKKELGNILGALQPGQGLTPRIHGKPKRLFTVSSFMYLQPGPIHHQHLNTPLLITLPMLSNELKAKEGKQQLVHWSGCQMLQCLQKIHEKGHVGYKFSAFSQWDTR